MERKNIRLKEYDYSRNGAYFITICTKDKKQIFWNNVSFSINIRLCRNDENDEINS